MFDQYTEAARRVIFFARHECSFQGSESIGEEHLLLGIMRQSPELVPFYLKLNPSELFFRLSFRHLSPPTPTHVDLPLTDESKRILAWAADEASLLNESVIRPEHLLLGILHEEQGFLAETLRNFGAPTLADVRLALAGPPHTGPRVGQVVPLTLPDGTAKQYLVADARREPSTDPDQPNAPTDDLEIVLRPTAPSKPAT